MKWQVTNEQALRMRAWDDEAVVYDSISGDTHLLGADAAALLHALLKAPCEAAELATLLAACMQTAPDGAAQAAAEQLLAELEMLALVEREAP